MAISKEQIKQFRKAHAMSQEKLADMAQVSLRTVKNWERDGIPTKQIKKSEEKQ